MSEVLVTGGSGFLASWAIVELLKRGHTARTTVRNLEVEPAVRAAIGTQVDPDGRLTFMRADLTKDLGWSAAVDDCEYVLHIAAPVGVHAPGDPNALIEPTRDGALRVLGAASGAGVRRVVMTSAVEACRPPTSSPDSVTDEDCWTDITDSQIGRYRLAKTLDERSAWDFIAKQTGNTALTTILPGAINGEVLGPTYAGSVQLAVRMLSGALPRLRHLGFCVVDVRDVADLHIRAMLEPAAANQRYIAASDWMWMSEVAEVLRAELGALADNVPTRAMPDWVLRLAALFKPDMRFVVPLLRKKHVFTSDKARFALGWEPRPAAMTVADMARSAIEIGAV